jgi:hypothetical protein
MATYTCSIGGTTRSLIVRGFTMHETGNGVDVLQGEVKSLDGSYTPTVDDDLFWLENGTRIFGGKVETVVTKGINGAGNTDGLILGVTAKSYSILPQRRIITITLAAANLKTQLTQLNTAAFATDFSTTIHASQANGPSMPEVSFTDTRCDQILDVMMKTAASIGAIGYNWKIDENNALRATYTGELAAPFNVVDGDGNAIRDIVVDETRNDLYANRLLIEITSGPATHTQTFVAADGVTVGDLISFTTDYPASESINDVYPNVLYIDGVAQSVIGFGSTQLPYGDWYWDYTQSPAVLVYPISGGRPFPTGAEEVTITFAIRYPITKIVEDAAGIAAYGPWDRKVRPPTALGDAALEDYAAGVLASQSPVRREARYPTLRLGVKPNMTQTLNSAKRNVNATVLVQEVTTTMLTSTTAERMVSVVASDAFQGTFRGTLEQWMDGSGGGGGAAVVTTGVAGSPTELAQYIVGAYDATLTNEAAIPGLYAGVDVQPESPGSLDDEFPGSALDGAWTNVNSTNLTLTVTNSRLLLETTAEGAGDHVHPVVRSVPGSTPWEVTCQLSFSFYSENFFLMGLCLRDSSTGRLVTFGPGYISGVGQVYVYRFSLPTGGTNAELDSDGLTFTGLYLRVKDDGTDHLFYTSPDGFVWTLQHQQSRTVYLATPDQVGVFVYNSNSNFGTKASFDWFRRTA